MGTFSTFVVLLWLLVAGCSQTADGENGGTPPTGTTVETVAEGLEVPWGIAFLPNARMLVTERPGRVRLIVDDVLEPEPLLVFDDVESTGESGLMDVLPHPDFSQNQWVYFSYAYDAGNAIGVRVVRYRLAEGTTPLPQLVDRQVIIDGLPAARFHAGCRMGFGPDGKLYITTGDATEKHLAQQLTSLAGKTLRLNDDGTVPDDNPFVGRSDARSEIFSYGHRNAQGITWQPGSGLMFQSEHGPSGNDAPGGGDEINIVEAGNNYGWPVIHHEQTREGMISPLLEYTPAVAPASATFYTGTTLGEFDGNLFVGCLRGERILRVVLDGRSVVSQEDLFQGTYGRIRAVAQGPDGALYFTTSNHDGRGGAADTDDRILRIVPSDN